MNRLRSRRGGLLIGVSLAIAVVSTLASASRSSRARPVMAPTGVLAARIAAGERRTIGSSGLSVRVDLSGVVVSVPDGGGAGAIPLHGSVVRQVVVTATESGFALDVHTGSSSWERVSIDRLGVRTDDDLYARFGDRVPPWLLALMVGMFVIGPLVAVRRGMGPELFLLASLACAALPWLT